MGILDDAIREHLDLKRRLGAEADELARLEGEAFGPATRPGDPDFPEQPPTGENAVAEQPDEPAEASAEAPALTPVEPIEEAPPEAAEAAEPVLEEPAPEPPTDDELPDAAVPLARELRAIVDPPPEEDAPAEVRPEDELDLDLDLDLDEPEPIAAADSQPTPPPQPIPGDTPIEGLDTVEHPFEGAIEDTGEVELVEGEIAEEQHPGEERDKDNEEEDEDVLEETPEFLREKPEDDELWFEQGEPKDFDF